MSGGDLVVPGNLVPELQAKRDLVAFLRLLREVEGRDPGYDLRRQQGTNDLDRRDTRAGQLFGFDVIVSLALPYSEHRHQHVESDDVHGRDRIHTDLGSRTECLTDPGVIDRQLFGSLGWRKC